MKKTLITLILGLFTITLVAQNIYLTGTMNGWNPADATQKLADNGNGVFYIEKTLPIGETLLKLTDGTWTDMIANDYKIVLTAPTLVKIYAKAPKNFICDTQEALYITGDAVGTYAWGGANMIPMTITGQQASVTTTIKTGTAVALNLYRNLTPNYGEPIYGTTDYSIPANSDYDNQTKKIVFDFATYTFSIQDVTAVQSVVENKLSYSLNMNQINIVAEHTPVEIYSVTGEKLINKIISGSFTYTFKQSGVYLIRSKGATYKVII